MPSFITSGAIAGVFSIFGALSIAVGKPALGAFFSDPTTATTFTAVITGGTGFAAGLLKGIKG
jgi:hypothetical protein